MQRAMGYAGAWHIDQSRFAQERLPPQVYLTVSYYQRWELAMEKNMVERGYVGADELDAGHALRPGKPLKRKLTPDVVKQGMTRQELGWMRNWLLSRQLAGIIDVEEEFRQPCFHITVYKNYVAPLPGPAGKPGRRRALSHAEIASRSL